MRYVWTDAGDDPSWHIGDKWGINGYFMPMFDSLTTREFLRDEIQARGHVAGIYLGHNWFPGLTPAQLAAKVNTEFKRVSVPNLKVQFNIENHDPDYVVQTLEAWRKLQPKVGTSWSMEGMQGGWMGPKLRPGEAPAPGSFVARVLATRVRLVPQTFTGDMRRQESDVVLRDLMRRGFPENIISPFYDAKQLGIGWDGYAFTMGRLPA